MTRCLVTCHVVAHGGSSARDTTTACYRTSCSASSSPGSEYFWKQKCLRFWTGACRQQAPLPPCLQFLGSPGCLAYGLLPSVMLLQFHLQFPRKAACLLHHPLSWVRAGLRQEMEMLLVRAHISIPFVSSWGHFPPDLSFDAKADPKAD